MTMAEIDNENKASYGGIAPYTDEETAAAIATLARSPYTFLISKYIFPKERINYLAKTLKEVKTADDFQEMIMSKAVAWVIANTCDSFTFDGLENIVAQEGRKYVAMSNHRDIVLDPAFTQYVMLRNSLPPTDIAVGDNLIKDSKKVEMLLRCNRMVTVVRGVSARELYLTSKNLSQYIRDAVTSGRSSIWIAQRQGRSKDGLDITEQGLLKMLDMSGTKSFTDNFEELNIIPLSVSYEYEPCDILKAREILISRSKKYVKKKGEDMISILTGIRQKKGHVHLHFGAPLTREEIDEASRWTGNDRYQQIRHVVNRRISDGYRLWKTNYIAYDLVYGGRKYADNYNEADVAEFKRYMEKSFRKVERRLDRTALREIFLRIYSNPVLLKEQFAAERLEKASAEAK